MRKWAERKKKIKKEKKKRGKSKCFLFSLISIVFIPVKHIQWHTHTKNTVGNVTEWNIIDSNKYVVQNSIHVQWTNHSQQVSDEEFNITAQSNLKDLVHWNNKQQHKVETYSTACVLCTIHVHSSVCIPVTQTLIMLDSYWSVLKLTAVSRCQKILHTFPSLLPQPSFVFQMFT